jgi:hypothetical protein
VAFVGLFYEEKNIYYYYENNELATACIIVVMQPYLPDILTDGQGRKYC